MSANEERDWKRFILIRGPIGEQRLDVHLAWLRHAVRAGYSDPTPTLEDCELRYSYKNLFAKNIEDTLEEVVANVEKDIAYIESRFRKNR
jgi:hypothetical protein